MSFDISVPFPLQTDTYTVSSNGFASNEARKLSVYNIINRKGPNSSWPELSDDTRMVSYGVGHFIRSFMNHKITQDEVVESQRFMNRANSFGGPLHFPFDLWMNIVEDFNGYLPLEIKALKDGSIFYPNIPYFQVKNTVEGYGELASHIEAVALGMISIATASATMHRHWLNKLKEWVKKDIKTDSDEVIYQTAQFLIHGFGMRSCIVPEQSALLGLSALLSFNGTDNTNSAYLAWKMNCKPYSATSIHALAHRGILSFNKEEDSFKALHKASNKCDVNIASYVSDCYNFQNAVANHLVKLCDKYPNDTFVARPDSGNCIDNILFILNQGKKNLRYIDGNSVNPKSMFETLQAILNAGFKSTLHGIFGVGGWAVNNSQRDSLSSKFAMSNCNGRKVVKFSEEIDKMTVPGPNIVSKHDGNMKVYFDNEGINPNWNLLETYYTANEDGPSYTFNCFEPFSSLQDRCIKQFDSLSEFAKNNPRYGLNRETLSPSIINIQDELAKEYNVQSI